MHKLRTRGMTSHIIHIPPSLYSHPYTTPRIITVWYICILPCHIVNEDYDMTPNPSILTLERGQETACSNITIHDDGILEMIEIFHVTVGVENSTFSAGVNLIQSRATVEIKDNDGELYIYVMKISSTVFILRSPAGYKVYILFPFTDSSIHMTLLHEIINIYS